MQLLLFTDSVSWLKYDFFSPAHCEINSCATFGMDLIKFTLFKPLNFDFPNGAVHKVRHALRGEGGLPKGDISL